jgi:hypothetical protein
VEDSADLKPDRPRTGVAARARRLGSLAGVLTGVLMALAVGAPAAAEETKAAGLLWGRIAVEEESPEGPWTPLVGVEVRLYPYAPEVAGDLEAIRQGARNSGSAYDAAVAEMERRLEAYTERLPKDAVRHTNTDPAGLFVFDDLPAGEWLVIAFRITAYRTVQTRPIQPRPRRGQGGDTFLPQDRRPAKEVEVWVSRVRVGPGDRARLALTDRSRFLVGPVR